MDKRNLIYNVFVGDGDTSSFARVKEACYAEFGECYVIRKEVCGTHSKKDGIRIEGIQEENAFVQRCRW